MPEEIAGFTKRQRDWLKRRDEKRCQFPTGSGKTCGDPKSPHGHHAIPRGEVRIRVQFEHPNFAVNGPLNGIMICAKHHIGKGVAPQTELTFTAVREILRTYPAFKNVEQRPTGNRNVTLEGVALLLKIYSNDKNPDKVQAVFEIAMRAWPNCIHPDAALLDYYRRLGGKQSTKKGWKGLRRGRVVLGEAGKKYWNTTWDSTLIKRADSRTKSYRKTHNEDEFPPNAKRGTNGRLAGNNPARKDTYTTFTFKERVSKRLMSIIEKLFGSSNSE